MFPKHPFSTGSIIQVFHEDHITSITKGVGLFVMKVLPRVVDLVVKPSNLNLLFLVVFRPLLFPRESALLQFQLALQFFKKLRWSYENTITGCQEFLQAYVNPYWVTMRNWVGNADIALQRDRGIPSISFPQDSHLFDHKSCRNGSVQVDRDGSNLGQLNMQVRYWVFLELRKQQRLELPIFLETRIAKSSKSESISTLYATARGVCWRT